MRASCSLDIHSEQDAFPYGNTALTHYQIVFLQNRDAPNECVNSYFGKFRETVFAKFLEDKDTSFIHN
ncbi:MAG: hypothetical protein AAF630_14925 [Cyanobacteria bacterium P01_C01_bin.38]